jgi:hypothetical protein
MAFVDIDILEGGIEVYPAGTYRLRVENQEPETSKSEANFGKPLQKITFTILSPETMADPLTDTVVQTGGKKLVRKFPLWKGAGGLISDLIRACGYHIGGVGFETKDINGSEVMAVITTKVFREQLSNDIERFYPVPQKGKESPGVRGMKATAESEEDVPF